jgi:hypothetical protein
VLHPPLPSPFPTHPPPPATPAASPSQSLAELSSAAAGRPAWPPHAGALGHRGPPSLGPLNPGHLPPGGGGGRTSPSARSVAFRCGGRGRACAVGLCGFRGVFGRRGELLGGSCGGKGAGLRHRVVAWGLDLASCRAARWGPPRAFSPSLPFLLLPSSPSVYGSTAAAGPTMGKLESIASSAVKAAEKVTWGEGEGWVGAWVRFPPSLATLLPISSPPSSVP